MLLAPLQDFHPAAGNFSITHFRRGLRDVAALKKAAQCQTYTIVSFPVMVSWNCSASAIVGSIDVCQLEVAQNALKGKAVR